MILKNWLALGDKAVTLRGRDPHSTVNGSAWIIWITLFFDGERSVDAGLRVDWNLPAFFGGDPADVLAAKLAFVTSHGGHQPLS